MGVTGEATVTSAGLIDPPPPRGTGEGPSAEMADTADFVVRQFETSLSPTRTAGGRPGGMKTPASAPADPSGAVGDQDISHEAEFARSAAEMAVFEHDFLVAQFAGLVATHAPDYVADFRADLQNACQRARRGDLGALLEVLSEWHGTLEEMCEGPPDVPRDVMRRMAHPHSSAVAVEELWRILDSTPDE